VRKTPALLACLLLPLAAAAAPEAPPAAGDPVGALDDAQVAQALEILRTRHFRGATLDGPALDRATLRGLLADWSRGAELVAQPAAAPAESAFRSEQLEGGVGYVRLGSLGDKNLAELDKALRGFAAAKVAGLVLDLRATPDSQDFAAAARVASRFVAPGTKLWSLAPAGGGSGRDFTAEGERLFDGTVVVVADGAASGAAEALAATLRRHVRALLVGTPTAGRAVEFAALPLGASGQLRVAVAEVKVDGLPPLHPGGLAPDTTVPQDPAERDRVLAAAAEQGAAPFIFERERARLNEAALVAGTNPEIAAAGADGEGDAGLMDRPLQRAVDLVTAIGLFRARADD
jgi:carboxyl-terminal processing protease